MHSMQSQLVSEAALGHIHLRHNQKQIMGRAHGHLRRLDVDDWRLSDGHLQRFPSTTLLHVLARAHPQHDFAHHYLTPWHAKINYWLAKGIRNS